MGSMWLRHLLAAAVVGLMWDSWGGLPGVSAHDGGILATLTQTIHHLFERPVINIGVQPLSHGHGIKLGVDAVIKTRKHPKKTTHHHHHHYDEEEEVIEEHVVDHHRTGEAKQSSRPRPRISFEIGRPRAPLVADDAVKVIDAPKISKRKKVVPRDFDEAAVEEKRAYHRKVSGEYVKAAGSGRYRTYSKDASGDPYIRSSPGYAYSTKAARRSKDGEDSHEDEPTAAGSGPIADYERRSLHSAGNMASEEDDE